METKKVALFTVLSILFGAGLSILPPVFSGARNIQVDTTYAGLYLDTPNLRPLLEKQASNDSFRRTHRVRNFQRLDAVEDKLANADTYANRVLVETRRIAAHNKARKAVTPTPDSEPEDIASTPQHNRKWWQLWRSKK